MPSKDVPHKINKAAASASAKLHAAVDLSSRDHVPIEMVASWTSGIGPPTTSYQRSQRPRSEGSFTSRLRKSGRPPSFGVSILHK